MWTYPVGLIDGPEWLELPRLDRPAPMGSEASRLCGRPPKITRCGSEYPVPIDRDDGRH